MNMDAPAYLALIVAVFAIGYLVFWTIGAALGAFVAGYCYVSGMC